MSKSLSNPAVRGLGIVALSLAAITAFYKSVGYLGFNPTDDGAILATSYRLLQGEIPHIDFISPRPVGSPLLHTLDFLIPLPLFVAGRIVALAEMLAFTYCFARVTIGKPLVRWPLIALAGALAAWAINVHTFTLMPWHTIDGLLVLAVGIAILSSASGSSRYRVPLAFVILGLGPLTKQGFAFAPLVGIIYAFYKGIYREKALKRVGFHALLAATPTVLYVATIAVLGGGQAMASQLSATAPDWGAQLFTSPSLWEGKSLILLCLHIVSGIAVAFLCTPRRDGRVLHPKLATVMRCGVTLVLLIWLHQFPFDTVYTGGLYVMWAMIAYFVTAQVVGKFDAAALVVLAAGWIAMLSWGYAVPNLVAGSMAFFLMYRSWTGVKIPELAMPALAVLIVVVVAIMSFAVRRAHPPRDLSKPLLTFPLLEISAEFGDIRTSDALGRHLQDIVDCVEHYPSDKVAILPSNAGLYPALGLENPLPIDWVYPLEYSGSESRLLRSAEQLEPSYLVIFQNFDVAQISSPSEVPKAHDIFWYDLHLVPGCLTL